MKLQKSLGIKIEATRQLEETDGHWQVPKEANRFSWYRVDVEPKWVCNCEDFTRTREWCRHIYAVRHRLWKEGRLPKRAQRPAATKKVERDWRKYNLGCGELYRDFKIFLHQLCQGLPSNPPSSKGGRPRIRLSDLVYAAVLKIREQDASRQMKSILEEDRDRKVIQRVAGRNSILSFFKNRETTELLTRLIGQCCRPLQAIETRFAFDSTHYGMPKRHEGVYDRKTDRTIADLMTFKAHVSIGVQTHVIAGITATPDRGEGTSDAGQFPYVLKQTADRFRVKEVLADSAYNSKLNHKIVGEVGAKLFTYFTSRDKGLGDGAYREAYFFQRNHPGSHYKTLRDRNQAESGHSIPKRMIADSLFSKTEDAARNEVLCIALVHNIICLVRAKYQRGMEIEL